MRSDSISSVASTSSPESEESFQIFVKNIAGDSKAPITSCYLELHMLTFV